MRSICFFSSYFKGSELPYFIKVYLTELKKQFSEVVFCYTDDSLSSASKDFLKSLSIDLFLVENKGFDFGQWYQAFQKFDVNVYDKIALVNDSCVLFKSLNEFIDWSSKNKADLQGITISNTIHKHIQSYFLIINRSIIPFVVDYFNKHKIRSTIGDVIDVYEIGLSKALIEAGFTIDAFMNNKTEYGEFSPYYYCLEQHIQDGIPTIKKKIIYSSYRKAELFTLARMNFNINVDHYLEAIKLSNKELIIDLDRLKVDLKNELNVFDVLMYNIKRKLIQVIRIFRKQRA